ncbi:LuxR C-terminal-related transcriptional regulator [Streptomyces sp. BR1]|uniref:LuxR C-terminal-related transcriptional regulator n=1 Tax=Streptomyces sp. BR1 TaxID=1592323 RepID=UPI00402BAF58
MMLSPPRSDLLPTPSQLRIAAVLAQGLATAQAAAKLHLATGTVSAHQTMANHRLGVRHRYAFIHACYVLNLLPRPVPAPPPDGGAALHEVAILWRFALDDSHAEVAAHCHLSVTAMQSRLQVIRKRWNAANESHLITLGWAYGVLNASRGTAGHQLTPPATSVQTRP